MPVGLLIVPTCKTYPETAPRALNFKRIIFSGVKISGVIRISWALASEKLLKEIQLGGLRA